MGLKPFIRYYGGKWRAAPRYPKPKHSTIVEPFAGAAGYSMRYHDLDIILIERYAVLAEMWRFLTSGCADDVRRTPVVDHVEDLPPWVPKGLQTLVGFAMNAATVAPCRQLSSGRKKLREMGRIYEGWSEAHRERVASQMPEIGHWRVVEGDYKDAPDIEATWFIDPPYNNKAGSYYVHSEIEYPILSEWCRGRKGQVLVCENEGADWLPFRPFATLKPGLNGKGSREVIWTNQ